MKTFSNKELRKMFDPSWNGRGFSEACDFLKTQVPKTILINGEERHHMPYHYDANKMLYAYFSAKDMGITYHTKTEAKQNEVKK